MAANFSANQFEKEFKAKSLCNWEVPHWYPKHPRHRIKTTKFIANDRGHLLPGIERPKSSPWGRYQNTWQLPSVITRDQANEINSPPVGGSRWALPDPNKTVKKSKEVQVEIKKEKEKEPKLKKEVLVAAPKVPEPCSKKVDPPKRVFNNKEKLNNPIAIAQNGQRAIRHETLERDNDPH